MNFKGAEGEIGFLTVIHCWSMLPEHVSVNDSVYKYLFFVGVFVRRQLDEVLLVFLKIVLEVRRTKSLFVFMSWCCNRVVTSSLWCQLLQKLNVELHTAKEKCIFLSTQQLGVHVLIGFQQLLILIAVMKTDELVNCDGLKDFRCTEF